MDSANMVPSSPPKKLLPAFPAMGKFVAGESGITHVYRDEDDVMVPGIMSSSPVKRSHVAAFPSNVSAAHATSSADKTALSTSFERSPPSSPCARAEARHEDTNTHEKLELQGMLASSPRTALCSLPIVSLTRPSPARVNTLIMEKRVLQNQDLMSKPSPQELLAILGEYYPPVAIGRSSLQSQVVLSKSNRQISRRHVTTWYDFDRHVVVVSCSGWNGCRVMNHGRVFRTSENTTLLEEAKLKYGDIFEPPVCEGQENSGSDSSGSFGTFLFKNDRIEVDSSEILVDVRGERFLIRLNEEEESAADAEMTNDETDDEELVPLAATSDERLNRVKRAKIDVPVEIKADIKVETETKPKAETKPVETVKPVDKENIQTKPQSTPIQTRPSTPKSTPKSTPRNMSNKPVYKTVIKKVMKPVVKHVSRPTERLQKPQKLEKPKAKEVPQKEVKVAKVEFKEAEAAPKEAKAAPKEAKAVIVEPKAIHTPKETETKPVEKPVEKVEKLVEETVEEPAEPVEQPDLEEAPASPTRESTPIPQTAKTVSTPKATPKATAAAAKTATATPRAAKTASPTPEPLSPSQIDFKAIRNLVCNHLAFSRLSCTPLQTVMAISPKISKVPKFQLQQILRSIDCVGIIFREGKDASGKPLSEEYYYVPEKDSDQDRVRLVNETKGGAGVRSCRKVHKQYYWKKPAPL